MQTKEIISLESYFQNVVWGAIYYLTSKEFNIPTASLKIMDS